MAPWDKKAKATPKGGLRAWRKRQVSMSRFYPQPPPESSVMRPERAVKAAAGLG